MANKEEGVDSTMPEKLVKARFCRNAASCRMNCKCVVILIDPLLYLVFKYGIADVLNTSFANSLSLSPFFSLTLKLVGR